MLIKQADPEVAEEWKWRGTPVWSHDGLICTGETYKSVVKMTFAKGASLKDPSGLFNSSLEGNARRTIDFHEGDKLDEEALKAHSGRRRFEQVFSPWLVRKVDPPPLQRDQPRGHPGDRGDGIPTPSTT